MIIWGSPCGNESFREKVPLVKNLSATNDSLWLLLQDGSLHRYLENENGAQEEVAFQDVTDVCAYGKQAFTVGKNGNVYRYVGSTEDNQSVLPGQEHASAKVWLPLLQSLKSTVSIVQVACGHSHTLMLARYGEMYSMGDNSFGQLGLHEKDPSIVTEPQVIGSLEGVPIRQIAAGGWHSFCIAVSGRVFVWGRNDFGQLGLGDSTSERSFPTLLKSFTDNVVAFISTGGFHTALLTKKGALFTFGLGSHGQLGHGDTYSNELAPRQVQELEGSQVTQVACGRHHTIAFVPGSAHVFVFGSNEEGQLGSSLEKERITKPAMAEGPWRKRDETRVKKVFAIGDRSFILLTAPDEESSDYRCIESDRQVATLDENLLSKIETCGYDIQVLETLRSIVHSPSCLIGSFSVAQGIVDNDLHGIDLLKASELISRLCKSDNPKVKKNILRALKHLIRKLPSDRPDIEALRVYILLPVVIHSLMPPSVFDWNATKPVEPPEREALFATKCLKRTFIPFLKIFLNLPDNQRNVLEMWFKTLDQQTFSGIIDLCKFSILDIFGESKDKLKSDCHDLPLSFAKKLFEINESCTVVRDKEFYLPRLPDKLLHDHFMKWKQKNPPSLCGYPFLLDVRAKNRLLEFQTRIRFNLSFTCGVIPALVLQIDRNNVVSDAIKNLNLIEDLQRPLWVQGPDDGGYDGAMWKDIFMLFFEEILQPGFDIFKEDETSKLLWFTGQKGGKDIYNVIGKMCGMAVYNNIIVSLNFPLALYKKLLGKDPNFEDFKEINPEIGNSLRQVLDFEEDDDLTVKNTFCMTFITPDGIPLKKSGEDIPVIANNREEYVKLYLDYFFNKSIQSQFDAFREGFWKACDREIVKLFRPEELIEMLNGADVYDWEDLKKATRFVLSDESGRMYPDSESGRFEDSHPVIKWLWEVLLSLSNEEKTKFLVFLTGSNKISLTGLEMNIIRVNECDDWMPYANVCSNSLHLHPYSSKEILEERLKRAIACVQG